MSKGMMFFYVALGLILAIGAYSIFLAVMLDKANKEIKQMRLKMLKMFEPPF